MNKCIKCGRIGSLTGEDGFIKEIGYDFVDNKIPAIELDGEFIPRDKWKTITVPGPVKVLFAGADFQDPNRFLSFYAPDMDDINNKSDQLYLVIQREGKRGYYIIRHEGWI